MVKEYAAAAWTCARRVNYGPGLDPGGFQNMRFMTAALAALSLLPAALALQDEGREVLPTNAVPSAYRLEVTPDANALSFSGTVEIDIALKEASDTLVLNGHDIKVERATVSDFEGTGTASYDEKLERITLKFPAALPAGKQTLKIAYVGKIYETSSGLFATHYSDNGVKKTMITTQFEPGYARRLAPMWDEPALKAVFDVAMVIPADQEAMSNMPVAGTDAMEGGKKRVRFAQTPKMSTYLLFVAAGDLERTVSSAEGVELGALTRKGDGARTKAAMEATQRILPYFNEYFGVKYPLPKLDQIAVPGAGGFSAMENWGAILYFENAFLIDPLLSTQSDRQGVFNVIAHEMAHQWFGDLVTMSWWSDLWLNEGFATWMQKKVSNALNPTWNVWVRGVGTQQGAMTQDARQSTHPIVQPAKNIEEAEAAFDGITYSKGQSIITMIEAYLGEDKFREGIRAYMKKHAYGNTVSENLWAALQAQSGEPVTDIAHDFTLQSGVPLLVVEAMKCEGGNTTVKVRQDRFAVDASKDQKLTWRVPVVAATAGGTGETRAVVNGAAELTVPGCGALTLNAGQTGYYRTLHTPEGFAALKADFAKLKLIDQLGLLHDTGALAMAGYRPVTDYLDIAQLVQPGADVELWGQVMGAYGWLRSLYRGEPGEDAFRAFMKSRLRPELDHLGWDAKDGEAPGAAILRSSLITSLVDLGDESVIAEARKRFDGLMKYQGSLSGDMRSALTNAVAIAADEATWTQLVKSAANAPSPLEQRFYLRALTQVNDPGLAAKTLDYLLSPSVSKQLGPKLIGAMAGNHPDLVWAFVLKHIDELSARTDAMWRFGFLPDIASASAHAKRADELKAYFDASAKDAPRIEMQRAIDDILYSDTVRTKRLPEVSAWLAAQPR